MSNILHLLSCKGWSHIPSAHHCAQCIAVLSVLPLILLSIAAMFLCMVIVVKQTNLNNAQYTADRSQL
jgi:hypothetical protein